MSELAIIKQENIQTIVSAAPQSYKDNQLSRDNCTRAGQAILEAIQQQGMTDNLDQQAAQYIDKARKTVKKMNERRAPVTQLFDTIRKEFTAMENAIDPGKVDTIPYKLQQYRNQFAAKKRAEEEERRRKEYERQQAEAARVKAQSDIQENLKQQFFALLNQANREIADIEKNLTLANYEQSCKALHDYPTWLPQDWYSGLRFTGVIPPGMQITEIADIEHNAKAGLGEYFTQTYEFQIANALHYIINRLPSHKAALERMAQSDAAEAARLKTEIEERQKKEAADREAERKRIEEEEKQKAEMARQQGDLKNLFSQQAILASDHQPKVKVAQRINLLNPEGIMPILSMWWSKEGCHLSVEEITKVFKKQITFCEKLAKEGTYINDESIEYIEEVKAK